MRMRLREIDNTATSVLTKRAALDLTFGRILLNLRSLWPCVLRIAAYQFSPELRVEALPESSKVGGRLHRAMIRRKKMDDERRPIRTDPRRLLHPKEVLQAGYKPRRASLSLLDRLLHAAFQSEYVVGDTV